jgi:recombination protein RecA
MSLDSLKDKINKEFGENTMNTASIDFVKNLSRFSSGSLALDVDLGGGYPLQRTTEIFGPESSGKSFMLYKAIAEVTSRETNNRVALIDEEGSYDKIWGSKLGIVQENLELVRGDYGEQSLDIMEILLGSGEFTLVALDSIAALVPKEELNGSSEDWQMGLLARLLGKITRKSYSAFRKASKMEKETSLIFVNQLRTKLGVMFGSPETTPGGNAVKFASSIRVDIRKDGSDAVVSENDIPIGQQSRYYISKNKTAPPLRRGVVQFFLDNNDYGYSIGDVANELSLIHYGLRYGDIIRSGAWYSSELFEGKVQGMTNLLKEIKDKPVEDKNNMIERLEDKIGYPVSFRFKE